MSKLLVSGFLNNGQVFENVEFNSVLSQNKGICIKDNIGEIYSCNYFTEEDLLKDRYNCDPYITKILKKDFFGRCRTVYETDVEIKDIKNYIKKIKKDFFVKIVNDCKTVLEKCEEYKIDVAKNIALNIISGATIQEFLKDKAMQRIPCYVNFYQGFENKKVEPRYIYSRFDVTQHVTNPVVRSNYSFNRSSFDYYDYRTLKNGDKKLNIQEMISNIDSLLNRNDFGSANDVLDYALKNIDFCVKNESGFEME